MRSQSYLHVDIEQMTVALLALVVELGVTVVEAVEAAVAVVVGWIDYLSGFEVLEQEAMLVSGGKTTRTKFTIRERSTNYNYCKHTLRNSRGDYTLVQESEWEEMLPVGLELVDVDVVDFDVVAAVVARVVLAQISL